jgi:broad specificity phosphatase PhoE
MALVHLVQHGEKAEGPDDPDLTPRGRSQARSAARMLAQNGIDAIHASPAKRTRRTAEIIAAECGALTVKVDERLRERMNWTAEQPLPTFLEEWAQTTADCDYQPSIGDSSRTAGQRLLAYLEEFRDSPISVAAATHGGVTIDLLRTLLGDSAVPPALLHARPRGPRRARGAPHPRQRRHPQNPQDPPLAGPPPRFHLHLLSHFRLITAGRSAMVSARAVGTGL